MNSCFNTANLVVLKGNVYERLYNHPTHKYRVILEFDHYDYVEDELLIARLNKEERI